MELRPFLKNEKSSVSDIVSLLITTFKRWGGWLLDTGHQVNNIYDQYPFLYKTFYVSFIENCNDYVNCL